MKKSVIRVLAGVCIGMAIITALIWLLGKALGSSLKPVSYAGHTISAWEQQLHGPDASVSNAAFGVIHDQVIPKLVDTMLHDTNDSSLRLWLIKRLNGLPGVRIIYFEALQRRAEAAGCLGELGPAAKSAVPDLVKALKANGLFLRGAAILSLGKIRSEPETVIPLLIPYLENDNLDVQAANALAEFGPLAKPAVPKLLPLLRAKDDDDRAAARAALLKIDPDAAAKAGVKMKTGR
jgi:HEAT repeat protein